MKTFYGIIYFFILSLLVFFLIYVMIVFASKRRDKKTAPNFIKKTKPKSTDKTEAKSKHVKASLSNALSYLSRLAKKEIQLTPETAHRVSAIKLIYKKNPDLVIGLIRKWLREKQVD